MAEPDIGRIKRNISKMIEMGAPEADIDAYISEEGVTLGQLQGSSSKKPPQPLGRTSSGRGGYNGNVPVIGDARAVIEALFPGVVITQQKRDPDSELGRKNPDSWHNHTQAAVDIRPSSLPKGVGYEQVLDTLRKAGFPIVHAKNEVVDPAKHATGPHFHLVLGPQMEGYPPVVFTPPELPESQDPIADALIPSANAATPANGNDAPVPTEDQTSAGQAGVLGFADSLTFGFGDEIDAGLGAVLGGEGYDTLWDGDTSLKQAYLKNRAKNRALLEAAQEEHLPSFIMGGLGSAIVPMGAAGKLVGIGKSAAKVAEGASGLSKIAKTGGKAAGAGAAYGGIYGVGSAEGGVVDHLENAGKMAAIGAPLGVAGAAAGNLIGKAVQGGAERFATKEASNNPFAAFDAEIVDDLVKTSKTTKGPNDPKGRAAITAKQINSVEQRYYAKFETMLNKLDMPEGEKLRLKEALVGRHSLPQEEVAALRGSVAGDAVADSITKVQRIRALTPELSRGKGALAQTAEAVSTGLDFVPGVPGIVGRSLRWSAKGMGGDVEAARVNAAEKLLKKEKAYQKLGLKVGPSGQRESQQALRGAFGETIEQQAQKAQLAQAAKAEMRISAQAEKAESGAYRQERRDASKWATENDPELQRRAQRLQATRDFIKASDTEARKFELVPDVAPSREPTPKDLKAFRQEITDPALDQRDLDLSVADRSAKQIASNVQSRNSAISKMERGAADWDAKLADPSTAPKPKATKMPKVSAAKAALDDAVAKGLRGDGRVQESYMNSLGIGSEEDLIKILDEAAPGLPGLEGELSRIKLNLRTDDGKLGSVIRPHLLAAKEKLGIKSPEAPSPTATKAAAPSAREAQLMARLDEIDPVVMTTETGSTRGSQIGQIDEAAAPEVASITKELEELRRMVPISRPESYQTSKDRNIGMSEAAASDLMGKVRPELADALKGLPDHAIHGIKTGDEARSFFQTDVMPRLQASQATPEEIEAARMTFDNIATFKPHQTPKSLEQGLYGKARN